MFSVWLVIASPILLTWLKNSFSVKLTLKPGIDSNLSIVPPVCPKPLPLILATLTPQDATIGEIIKVVLSPTPPVECLSTTLLPSGDRSSFSPESAIYLVSE